MKPEGPDIYKLDRYNDPYKLDQAYSTDHHICVSALTNKNASFIEAIIRLDSNYADDDVLEKVGSTRFWFDFISKNRSIVDFTKGIYEVVKAIDKANSTHLVACEDGWTKMADTIINYCTDYDGLIFCLQQDIDTYNWPLRENHLFCQMSAPMKCKNRDGTERCNISFASKFLSCASHYLLGDDTRYPKYDRVVSQKLPYYVYVYLGETFHENDYQVNGASKSYEEKIDIYIKYVRDIRRILALPSVKKEGIDFNTFDHIIWYCNK